MSFNNPVVGGENGELIRASIQSPDYVTGVSGWTINRDGSAEFNNVTIRFDLATGSIVVGPNTGPQVIVTTSVDGGLISFPVNKPYSNDAVGNSPEISGDFDDTGERVGLTLNSGFSDSNPGLSSLSLWSTEEDTDNNAEVTLGAYGGSGTTELIFTDTTATLETPNQFEVNSDVLVRSTFGDGNYALYIPKGRVATATSATTLGAGVDTAVTNATCTNTFLRNGNPYRVDVQIGTRQSVGASAAGTQTYLWKLWDGAVGGTQLGTTVQKMNGSVGNVIHSDSFSFTFNHTGTSALRTLTLSGQDAGGADTLQAVVNNAYSIVATNIGDTSQITNL